MRARIPTRDLNAGSRVQPFSAEGDDRTELHYRTSARNVGLAGNETRTKLKQASPYGASGASALPTMVVPLLRLARVSV